MNNRIIVIGDIHGCAKTLRVLITKIQPTSNDRIIMLGDYFDRGPRSAEVYKYLQVMDSVWNCTFLKGNHEHMMVKAVRDNDAGLWMYNGGYFTKESFNNNPDIVFGEVINWARKLPLWTESEKYYFVHAGLPYGNPEDNDDGDMLWDRRHLKSSINAADKTVVFGHTPQYKPYKAQSGNICIDSGCVFGGKLTAMIIDANNEDKYSFISVDKCD